MENKIRHLETIQGIINRMAGNSFTLKGWAVTLVVGIFALAGKDIDKMYFFAAYIPILTFWGLDAYYLLQERLYRALYDKVRLLPKNKIDFSLNPSQKELGSSFYDFFSCLISKTEFCFYISLMLVSTLIIILSCV